MNRGQRSFLQSKRSFYDGLAALEADDDSEPDIGRQASENALKQAVARVAASKPRNVARLRQPMSSDRPVEDHSSEKAVPCVLSRISEEKLVHVGNNMAKVASAASVSKANGKRKREPPLLSIIGEKQLFKGLQFYFFPNNDIAPARRMRIAKAVEYGATWHKNWGLAVTHIILDKGMTYADFLKYNKVQEVPGYVIVVHENYPADCISYRTLLDPKLPEFAVKGHITVSEQQQGLPTTKTYLEVKPAGKDVRLKARPTETQKSPQDVEAVVPRPTFKIVTENPASSNQIDNVPDQTSEEMTEDFRQALEQAKALQNLPLEDEEESNEAETGDGGRRSTLPLAKKQKPDFQSFQDRFQCMHKHTGEKRDSPNLATVEILQQMADYYSMIGDEWRTFAYRKAMNVLRNHPTKVVTKRDALQLPNIGERLASKIEEIAFTNRLQRLENARAEPSDQTLQTFMRIHGVGFLQASKWVHEGHSTLNDLLLNATLTENQQIGIEHYDDFNSRIPRDEVEQHGSIVRHAAQEVDASLEVIITGSYRRGSPTSGDIDCIITSPTQSGPAGLAHLRNLIFNSLLPNLFNSGFFVASLASSSSHDDKSSGSKWMGATCLPNSKVWRRMDLLLVPADELGAALIYFTGNDIFNRSLRLLASKKGMRLNQRGLYRDVLRGKDGGKVTEGSLVEGKDERKIFEVLGVPWRPPEHRIC